MLRFGLHVAAIALMSVSLATGQDKKDAPPRTLQGDAEYLASVRGWQAGGVPATSFDGKKVKLKLSVDFAPAKGKSAGELTMVYDSTSIDTPFELVERDGKRFLKVPPTDGLLKFPGFTLEYVVGEGTLTLKGGKAQWGTYEVDFGAGVPFKGAK